MTNLVDWENDVVIAFDGNKTLEDVNLDGAVCIADALRVLRIAVGLNQPTPADLALGDVAPVGAPEGVIDIADALAILRATVGLIVI